MLIAIDTNQKCNIDQDLIQISYIKTDCKIIIIYINHKNNICLN